MPLHQLSPQPLQSCGQALGFSPGLQVPSPQLPQSAGQLAGADLGRAEAERVVCGDICAIVGMEDVDIGDTVADREHPEPLPIIAVDEPTLSMSFMANNSPGYGTEGRYSTNRQLRERLHRELERDVALRVEDTASSDTFRVSGRGILHLSILMETMRREGYEFMVGQPQVIFRELGGKKAEPVEELTDDDELVVVG